jgi:hypothetical protein
VTAKQRNDAILARLPHQHGGDDQHHCEDGVIDRGDSIAGLWSIFAPPRTSEIGGDKRTIAGPPKLCRDWYCHAPRMTEKIETRFHAARQLVFNAFCALAEFERSLVRE